MRNMQILPTAKRGILAALMLIGGLIVTANSAEQRPLADGHIHYSHDAWAVVSAERAVALIRQAGIVMALVSSSPDEGTQRLYRAAPDLVVPVLRPYRKRGELGTWVRDLAIIDHVEERLKKNVYAGIGEFHVNGADADLPVVRRMVELARQYRIFLHVHSDADAVDRIFKQDPQAVILWAHAGFEPYAVVHAMMKKHKNLRADLSFRSEYFSGGELDPQWLAMFTEFPDRFVLGTDTYTPSRWSSVGEHAEWSQAWIAALPAEIADRIALDNVRELVEWALKK